MTLHLVRHGRPLVDRGRPAAEWELDPGGFDDVWALRESGVLPRAAAWFTSPEPKAVQTAQLLTEGDVGILDGLREHVRATSDWIEDFEAVVERAFAHPDLAAYDGWEPLDHCRARVVRAYEGIAASHAHDDVVLIGHGTAWTVLAAELTGQPPDLDRWRAMAMPDVLARGPRKG